jgi:hypothetical protein
MAQGKRDRGRAECDAMRGAGEVTQIGEGIENLSGVTEAGIVQGNVAQPQGSETPTVGQTGALGMRGHVGFSADSA